MKVLIDESLDVRLRKGIVGHDVFTVTYLGWKGLEDGPLLQTAEENGFDVLVTGDRNAIYQQNITGRQLAVVVLTSVQMDILEPNMSLIVAAIESAPPGEFLTVECGRFTRKIQPEQRQELTAEHNTFSEADEFDEDQELEPKPGLRR